MAHPFCLLPLFQKGVRDVRAMYFSCNLACIGSAVNRTAFAVQTQRQVSIYVK